MSYAYFAVTGDDGKPVAVHAHIEHVPENSVPITREQAVEITAARKVAAVLTPDAAQTAPDVTAVLKAMVEQMAAMKAELDALKNADVVVAVNKDNA